MPGRPDSSAPRALARLYSPPTQRAALATLCALESEIRASLRPGLDHEIAHARLAWWREECVRTVAARPTHPLTRELGTLFGTVEGEPLAGIGGLVDTAVWDLAGATFESRRELAAYCERWSAALIEPLVRLGAAAVPPAQARTLGLSLRESELLLALAADAHEGRLRLPLDELERAGVSPETLAHPPWSPGLAAVLAERYRAVRKALTSSIDALPPAAREALPGIIVWAALADRHCARAAQRLPQAPSRRDPHTLSDGWRAWRAARRAAAGRGLAE
jgi:phytoene synthase